MPIPAYRRWPGRRVPDKKNFVSSRFMAGSAVIPSGRGAKTIEFFGEIMWRYCRKGRHPNGVRRSKRETSRVPLGPIMR